MKWNFHKAIVLMSLFAAFTRANGQGMLDWSDVEYENFGISVFSPNPDNPGLPQTGNTIYDYPPGNAVYHGGWIGYTLGSPGPGVGPTPTSGPGGYNYQIDTNFEVGLYLATSLAGLNEAINYGTPVATTGVGGDYFDGDYGVSGPMIVSPPGFPAGAQVYVGIAAWYSGGGASSYAASVGDVAPNGFVESTNSVTLTAAPDPPANLEGIGLTSFSLVYGWPLVTPRLDWTNPAPVTYGTPLSSTQLDAVAGATGQFFYDPVSGTVLDAGTNSLFVSFDPYDIMDFTTATDSVSLVVLRAPLTVNAADAIRAFGVTNPVFTGTITGLTNQDNITALYTCTATASSPPGTYAITPTLVDTNNRLANYTVTTNDGTLTVVEPPNILAMLQSDNSFTFTWSAISNQVYQVQSTTNLGQGGWTNLGGASTATNSTVTISEPVGTTNSEQFYRVVLLP
jgi:MBG domain (YGX type)